MCKPYEATTRHISERAKLSFIRTSTVLSRLVQLGVITVNHDQGTWKLNRDSELMLILNEAVFQFELRLVAKRASTFRINASERLLAMEEIFGMINHAKQDMACRYSRS